MAGYWFGYAHEMRTLWLFVLATACTTKNPAFTCPDGTCSDPGYPFCDADGTIGGQAGTCIAVSCSPGTFAACDGNSAITCNASGDNYDVTPCAAECDPNLGCVGCTPGTSECGSGVVNQCSGSGAWTPAETCIFDCVASPTPHCAYLQPKYLPDICDAVATDDKFEITSSATMDTTADPSCNGGILPQTGGPDICIVRYKTISIDANKTFAVKGTRALALVSDGDLRVDGTLDIAAHGSIDGPGGGLYRSGGSVSGPSAGGGAGFHQSGGAGANLTVDGGASNGGLATTDPALLNTLISGPRGGGGAAGGAATLISCRGRVTVSGMLSAGGGGGIGGFPSGGAALGGGGGGGYTVLQGLAISVTGAVYANGGGGGAGGNTSTTTGGAGGDDGTLLGQHAERRWLRCEWWR